MNLPLIVLLIFLLLIPQTTIKSFGLDKWTTLNSEGMVAFQINRDGKEVVIVDDTPAPPVDFPKNHPKSCRCGGTGKVKGPDNIIDVPCPVKYTTGAPAPVQSTKTVPFRQVIMFTKFDCTPCLTFKSNYGAILQKDGFGFNEDANSLIRIVDVNKYPDIWQKYGGSWRYVPQFVLIEDGKVGKTLNPFVTQTAETVKKMLEQ